MYSSCPLTLEHLMHQKYNPQHVYETADTPEVSGKPLLNESLESRYERVTQNCVELLFMAVILASLSTLLTRLISKSRPDEQLLHVLMQVDWRILTHTTDVTIWWGITVFTLIILVGFIRVHHERSTLRIALDLQRPQDAVVKITSQEFPPNRSVALAKRMTNRLG